MIPENQLEKLKYLFAKDGISLTNAQALEIAYWLLARVRPVMQPIPNDNMALYVKIKSEVDAIRRATRFVNLYDWRMARSKTSVDPSSVLTGRSPMGFIPPEK